MTWGGENGRAGPDDRPARPLTHHELAYLDGWPLAAVRRLRRTGALLVIVALALREPVGGEPIFLLCAVLATPRPGPVVGRSPVTVVAVGTGGGGG